MQQPGAGIPSVRVYLRNPHWEAKLDLSPRLRNLVLEFLGRDKLVFIAVGRPHIYSKRVNQK